MKSRALDLAVVFIAGTAVGWFYMYNRATDERIWLALGFGAGSVIIFGLPAWLIHRAATKHHRKTDA